MDKKDYKPTLNLPRTDFSMKADLVRREPAVQERWAGMDLYGRLRKARAGAEKFVFHDGPPYANGDVHIGTALNKVLKDFVVRHRSMAGLDCPFVPGWDCHGLPIEHRVLKEAGPEARSLSPAAIRERCRKYAEHFLDHQRRQFRRLGCLGDWERPYRTMDPSYEEGVLSVFEDLVRAGFVKRDKRSTTWCPSCATALAEAELEYRERESPSIFVRFEDADGIGRKFGVGGEVALLIWTTTPWTLPGNLAIAVHPDLEYVAMASRGPDGRLRHDVVAKALVERVAAACGLEVESVSDPVPGRELEGLRYSHCFETAPDLMVPEVERTPATFSVVLGEYVSADEGTGCVHTAPGHGMDDFLTGLRYGLPVLSPVDAQGRYTQEAGPGLEGKQVPGDANRVILEALAASGALVAKKALRHSYAHCWRCKGPILYRATDQWFVRVDHRGLRDRAVEQVEKGVRWFPDWGQRRIGGMLRDRPDWCISRQRFWGIPIPALRCTGCLAEWTSAELVARTREVVRREGADAWFTREAAAFSGGERCPHCGSAELALPQDIFDVWFESGSSWRSVVQAREEHGGRFPADLVLEGTDQHRGWFQLSLLPSVAVNGTAPWRAVVTHGFIVDEQGEKVSKSRGGLLNADEIAERFGVDLFRLWVASVDYQSDIPVSEDLLKRVGDPYRRIRNTFRWILGNLDGFDPAADAVPPGEMLEADRWVLARLAEVVGLAGGAFERYDYSRAFRGIFEFCDADLSSFYFDFSKDRFYCEERKGLARRSGQTALLRVADALCRMLAPVLVHTCEEVWALLPGSREESVHLARWPRPESHSDQGRLQEWRRLRTVREAVAAECERLRASKEIGSNQEASVSLRPGNPTTRELLERFGMDDLAGLLMVSEATLGPDDPTLAGIGATTVRVTAKRSAHAKCARCWNLRRTVGKDAAHPDLCERCARVVQAAEG